MFFPFPCTHPSCFPKFVQVHIESSALQFHKNYFIAPPFCRNSLISVSYMNVKDMQMHTWMLLTREFHRYEVRTVILEKFWLWWICRAKIKFPTQEVFQRGRLCSSSVGRFILRLGNLSLQWYFELGPFWASPSPRRAKVVSSNQITGALEKSNFGCWFSWYF